MKVGAFQLQEPLPVLREPHVVSMVHPWVDAGNVGTLALTRLERYFNAEEIGKLERPGTFFDFTRYRPTTRWVEGKRTIEVPNTTISFAHREESPDLIFIHVMEPHMAAEDYITSLVELMKTLGIKRYTRLGGMWDAVPHTRPLLVTGMMNNKPLDVKGAQGTRRSGQYEGPTTILGQLNTELETLGIENANLMVHLPQYLQLEEDFTGSARLLEVLAHMYNLPSDLPETEHGRQQYSELNAEVERNPEAKRLVRRLEAHYDNRAANQEQRQQADNMPPLAPDIQKFLQDLGKKLDEPQ